MDRVVIEVFWDRLHRFVAAGAARCCAMPLIADNVENDATRCGAKQKRISNGNIFLGMIIIVESTIDSMLIKID